MIIEFPGRPDTSWLSVGAIPQTWEKAMADQAIRRTRWMALAVVGALVVLIGAGAAAQAHPALAASSLRQAAEARGIRMGTALTASSNLSGNAKYMATAAREFDAVTPGNEMKWGSVEPQQGVFNWTGADQIVSFAQANHMVVRGHNLVWHQQLPGWLTGGGFSGPQVLQLMQQHIATEAGRFAGKVIAWDVVNEPFNEDGSLRSDIFEQASGGSGYIATALAATHQADPGAKLYLNDFNIEGVNAKSTAMLNLVTSLEQQGVPIDGVGFESHFILGQVPPTIQQNIQRFVNAGVQVWITELDDRITLSNGTASAAQLTQQASDYAAVVSACLAVTGCAGVTVWGFTDLDSWIPSAFPGQGAADLFDSNIDPKPAYGALLGALGGTPASPTPTPTSPTPTPTPVPTGALTTTAVVASSSPWFNEEDVKLADASPLSALTVTIVVQRTTGVSFSGLYNTAGGQITQSSASTASAVTYTFTLAAGQTLPAGSFTFAAQTSGSGTAHPTAGDTFAVSSSAGTVSGHF
jgi:endo-1,4-beta-xylanase